MANATDKTPTLEEEMAAFKGISSEDGVTTAVQDGKTPIEAEDDTQLEGEAEAALTGEEGETAPKPAKGKDAQKRIDQAVRRQRSAERERDEARAELAKFNERLARLEGKTAPLTTQNANGNSQVDPDAPDPAKYQYGELDARYIAALARYETRKELDGEKAKAAETTRAQERQALIEQTKTFVVNDSQKFPDFKEAVFDSAAANEWPLSETVGKLAMESEVGHEILYHLATHPDEAIAVYNMPPVKQAAWFGKREAAVEPVKKPAANAAVNGSVRRASNAPPPPAIRLRGGGTPNPVSEDTTDFRAFERLATGKAN